MIYFAESSVPVPVGLACTNPARRGPAIMMRHGAAAGYWLLVRVCSADR
jgi:hypothetical protein